MWGGGGGGGTWRTSLKLLAVSPMTFHNRQCVETCTQHAARADDIRHHGRAYLCIQVLWRAGLCWGAAGRWHNLPVVVLACEVGGPSVFQTGNPVQQMVPLVHQAANTLQLSAHMLILFALGL